jgi:hypothetical protein
MLDNSFEVAKLVAQIASANSRADEAWKNWDAVAYEGACNSSDRYYEELVALVGKNAANLV